MLLNRVTLRHMAALLLPTLGLVSFVAPARAADAVVAASATVDKTCVGDNGAVDFTATLYDPTSTTTTFNVVAEYGALPPVILGSNWYDGSRHGDIVAGTLFEPYGSNSPYDPYDTVTITVVDSGRGVVLTDPSVVINRTDCAPRPNRAPTAQAVADSMWQYDASTTLTLKGSDPDAGDVLTYSLVSQPSYGTATQVGDQVTYVPDSTSFTGTDSFEYMVEDAAGLTAQASVSIMVKARSQLEVQPPLFVPTDVEHDKLATLTPPDTSGVVCYYLADLTNGLGPDLMIGTQYLSEGRQWEWTAAPCPGISVMLTGATSGRVDTPWMLRPQSDVQCYNGVCLDNNNEFDVWFRYQNGRVRIPAGAQDFKVRTSLAELHWAMEKEDGTVLQLGLTALAQFRPTGSISFQCQGPRHRAIMRVDNRASTVPVEMSWAAPGVIGAGKAAPGKSWSRSVAVRPPGKVRVTAYWSGNDNIGKLIGLKKVPKACR